MERLDPYSPTLGQWLQADPLQYAAGVNLYSYESNNPGNSLDPNGTTEKHNSKYRFKADVWSYSRVRDNERLGSVETQVQIEFDEDNWSLKIVNTVGPTFFLSGSAVLFGTKKGGNPTASGSTYVSTIDDWKGTKREDSSDLDIYEKVKCKDGKTRRCSLLIVELGMTNGFKQKSAIAIVMPICPSGSTSKPTVLGNHKENNATEVMPYRKMYFETVIVQSKSVEQNNAYSSIYLIAD